MIYIPIILIGLSFGSFYNVVIYRLPIRKSIISPHSFCPACMESIPWHQNIPILSFILIKGKCTRCKNKISTKYPLVELMTGMIWLWSFSQYELKTAIFFVIITGILTIIGFIDLSHRIIPISLIISGLLILSMKISLFPEILSTSLWGAVTGFSYLGIVMLITKFFYKKETMGWGDLLLIIILGAWIGPMNIGFTILLSAVSGLGYWFLMGLLTQFDREMEIPFGFFLSFSAIIVHTLDINWKNLLSFP